MKLEIKSLEETQKLAIAFAHSVKASGAFVSLFGDIGAGKTAFTRFVLKELGVKEHITSPSFVILNEYKGASLPIYHFDLYRLELEGVDTIKEELREYSKENVLTFVEWADFSFGELPYDRINLKIAYDTENLSDTRYFEFEPIGESNIKIVESVINEYLGV